MPRRNVKHERRERVLNAFITDVEVKTAGYNVSDKLALGLRAELGTDIANQFDNILQTGDFNSVDDETLGKIFDFLGAIDIARGDGGEQLFRDMESAMVDRGFWGMDKKSDFTEEEGYSHGPYTVESLIVSALSNDLGGMIGQQFQDIVDGEEFEKQNSNALKAIYDWITDYLSGADRPGDGLEYLYNDIDDYLSEAGV